MVDHGLDPNPPASAGQAGDGERVAKALARAGVASRREVERLIAAGRVRLNGQLLDTPAVKVAPGDILTVDGVVVGEAEPTRVWRYHKPAGLVTTHKDPKGRPTVFERLPPGLPRVISVGRLDLNSEGLLLLTNDGALARALELPANGVVRRYRARARGQASQARLDTLKDGITVDGVRYGPIEAVLDKAKEGPTGANLWITVTLHEGKNREVRKVLEAIGLTVNRLIRLSYGPFQLGTLAAGEAEEVGPRVIREQLARYIDAANLPRGERAAAVLRPAAPARAQRRAGAASGGKAEPARARTEYKPGWAKPKARPAGARPAGAKPAGTKSPPSTPSGPKLSGQKPSGPKRPAARSGPGGPAAGRKPGAGGGKSGAPKASPRPSPRPGRPRKPRG